MSKVLGNAKFFVLATPLIFVGLFYFFGVIPNSSVSARSSVIPHSNAPRDPFQRSPQFYQEKCRECHGDSADQRFYQRLTVNEMIQTILKGRMMDKPPDMPAFEEKGVTSEQARDLALYMQELRRQSTNKKFGQSYISITTSDR